MSVAAEEPRVEKPEAPAAEQPPAPEPQPEAKPQKTKFETLLKGGPDLLEAIEDEKRKRGGRPPNAEKPEPATAEPQKTEAAPPAPSAQSWEEIGLDVKHKGLRGKKEPEVVQMFTQVTDALRESNTQKNKLQERVDMLLDEVANLRKSGAPPPSALAAPQSAAAPPAEQGDDPRYEQLDRLRWDKDSRPYYALLREIQRDEAQQAVTLALNQKDQSAAVGSVMESIKTAGEQSMDQVIADYGLTKEEANRRMYPVALELDKHIRESKSLDDLASWASAATFREVFEYFNGPPPEKAPINVPVIRERATPPGARDAAPPPKVPPNPTAKLSDRDVQVSESLAAALKINPDNLRKTVGARRGASQ